MNADLSPPFLSPAWTPLLPTAMLTRATMGLQADRNIILIGMPGVGKSTVGVLLAKASGRRFLDTDVHLQARRGRRLQELLDAEGGAAFRQMEKAAVLSLDPRGTVVATGGSVVYSDEAMAHLKATGPVVHLELAIDLLERRLTNLPVRGVVMEPRQTLAALYDERMPLYRRWADLTVDCAQKTHEKIVAEILHALGL